MKKEFVISVGTALALMLMAAGAYSQTLVPLERKAPIYGEMTERQVSFRVLESGEHAARVSARKNYAAYTPEALMQIWAMAHGKGAPPPDIDFSKEFVIAVFAGQQPTGGHSIVVAAVIDALDTRIVDVKLVKPGAGCMVTEALTTPYQIVAVPISDAPLMHKDLEEVSPC
jgi:hypothetical protein